MTTPIEQARLDLTDAARILRAWERSLQRDNRDGHRDDDAAFLRERAERYERTAAGLQAGPAHPRPSLVETLDKAREAGADAWDEIQDPEAFLGRQERKAT